MAGSSSSSQKKPAKKPAPKKKSAQSSGSSSSGFNSAAHPRAPAGTSAGGQFAVGGARDSKAAAAQKDQRSFQAIAKGADPHGLNSKDLEQASRVAYSSKSSDPKLVALRKKIAAEMGKRGLDVKKYGALGGGITAKKKPAPKKAAPKKKR